MTETESPPASGSDARSAGAMLRAARERQGLHIAALAAAIKVPPAKLDALENGRHEELTDNTFVRALAQSVCRVLKVDPKPVLELLPAAGSGRLDKVEGSIRAPFRERPGQESAGEARPWHQPVFWVVMVLLVAAAAFVMWPRRGTSSPTPAVDPPAAAPKAAVPAERVAASAPMLAVAPPVEPAPTPQAPAVVTETVHSAPPPAASQPALPAGAVVLRATEPSWVEVSDARGGVLLSRTLQPGESVGLEGAAPWKLTIGNGPATEVLLRGRRVTLAPAGRDNVVRMELR